MPYFSTLKHFFHGRHITGDLAASMCMERQSRSKRILWFSDTVTTSEWFGLPDETTDESIASTEEPEDDQNEFDYAEDYLAYEGKYQMFYQDEYEIEYEAYEEEEMLDEASNEDQDEAKDDMEPSQEDESDDFYSPTPNGSFDIYWEETDSNVL